MDIPGSQPELQRTNRQHHRREDHGASLVGVVGKVGENPLSIIFPRARDRFREMALAVLG
jgi:hypothetical protein